MKPDRTRSIGPFVAGAVTALALAALPVTAVLADPFATDASPRTYDGTSPLLTLQPTTFVLGSAVDAAGDPALDHCGLWNLAVPLRLRWSGSDATSGLEGFDVFKSGPVADPPDGEEIVHATSATTYRFIGGNYDSSCGGGAQIDTFWVVARDNRGNSARSLSVGQWLDVRQEDGYDVNVPWNQDELRPTRTGTWTTSNCACFNGGHTLFSTTPGATLTYTFTTRHPGQTVALVLEENSNRGEADISVDGGAATSVDSYASSPTTGSSRGRRR